MKKLLILLTFTILISCNCNEKQEARIQSSYETTVKVYYQNGQSEIIKIPTYPRKIYLCEYEGSSTIKYFLPEDKLLSTIAATGVRRFEIVK